jgi:hypothetical protein
VTHFQLKSCHRRGAPIRDASRDGMGLQRTVFMNASAVLIEKDDSRSSDKKFLVDYVSFLNRESRRRGGIVLASSPLSIILIDRKEVYMIVATNRPISLMPQ